VTSFCDLTGRAILVTGAGSGLGRAIAQVLAEARATVVVNDIHADRVAATVALLTNLGLDARAGAADVTDAQQIDQLFTRIEAEGFAIDSLVICATPAQRTVTLEHETWEYNEQMLDVFVKSPLLLTQRALPRMKAQSFGRIVNITSEVFETSEPGSSAYVAAKGAQIGWSRSAAKELAEFGITVNTVAPGFIPVERHRDLPQSVLDGYLATVPAGRWGTPEEIGHAVRFFMSDEAAFVSGQTLIVNGGRTPH
jgi:3-oxoacyl-[acyl-carrier protein] reductase